MKLDLDAYLDDDDYEPGAAGSLKKTAAKKSFRRGQQDRVKFLADIAEHSDKVQMELHERFIPTFHASEHERYWILNYLEEFYNNQVIADVVAKVKGGKEANVYCCTAHPSTGLDLIAAKIYRPRLFRNLRNDSQYRQGRELLDEDGKASHARRETLAMSKNTRFGKVLRHVSWLEAEYQTLLLLHKAGADVPKPIAHGNNVILMEYVGGREIPAPALNQVALTRTEARVVFDRLVEDVSIMLACHRVHADLSAYNVLFWEGGFKIIDFPQAVDPRRNADASALFVRDVTRLCQYFSRYGIRPDPLALADSLWNKFILTNALDAGYDQDDDDA